MIGGPSNGYPYALQVTAVHLKEELNVCLEALKRGELTPDRLQAVIDSAPDRGPGKRQSLLYVQTSHNAVHSDLLGYTLVINGEAQPGSHNRAEWPYRSVADAIKDGWRIISFPNTALLMDPDNTYGIGPEFILEKMEYIGK